MMIGQNLVGTRLGQYEIRELIGSGGMGAVYRAFQPSINRHVAIKVLPGFLSSDQIYMNRFLREARVAAALEHPHITPIYDYGVEGEIAYLVMRMVTGGSLAQRLSDDPDQLPSLNEVSELLGELASALDYAHKHGVIHRDLKPGNILFDTQGTPYLSDFGIAKLLNNDEITATGQIMGTPTYMSPEQWKGGTLSGASDQYSLAVIVYQLVTGRVPFKGDTPYQVMHGHLYEEPPPADSLRPELSPSLSRVIQQALAKEPDKRFATITEFANAFKATVGGSTENQSGFFATPVAKPDVMRAAPPVSPTQPFIIATPSVPDVMSSSPSRSAKANPARFILPVAALLVVIGAGGYALVTWGIPFITQNQATLLPLFALLAAVAAGWYLLRHEVTDGLRERMGLRPRHPRYLETISPPSWDVNLPYGAQPVSPVTPPPFGAVAPPPAVTSEPAPKTAPPPPAVTPEPVAKTAPPPPPAPAMRTLQSLQEGQQLGIYELRKRLDTGERNRVYHAYDPRMERDVAIKILGLGDEHHRLRFEQEIKILHKLNHPHIVPFFDSGRDGSLNYLVMPLLEGGSLKGHLNEQQLPLPRITTIVHQVAGALDYLHGKGVIHRDLKTSNIMFGEQENAYIVDFGIAKLQEAGVNLTRVGDVIGTPYYIPPELWIGDTISPASDQYSLGVIVFQMLTGRLPFSSEDSSPFAMMHMHVYDPPPIPSEVNPQLPREVDQVVLKALAKRPQTRYETVLEFATALERALSHGQPLEAGVERGHIFISYSRTDQEYALKLADHMRKNGFGVWIDANIDYGERWFKEITAAIQHCSAVVVLMTPDAENSTWVEREILLAHRERKPILPLLLRGGGFSIFINLQHVDVTHLQMPGADFYTRLSRMVSAGKP